jgi:hypothetical protein
MDLQRSWSSVDTQVYYDFLSGMHSTLATVDDVCVTTIQPDSPYGQISSGRITIEGPVTNFLSLDAVDESSKKQVEAICGTDRITVLLIFGQNALQKSARGLLLVATDSTTYRRVGTCAFLERFSVDSDNVGDVIDAPWTFTESCFERRTNTIV